MRKHVKDQRDQAGGYKEESATNVVPKMPGSNESTHMIRDLLLMTLQRMMLQIGWSSYTTPMDFLHKATKSYWKLC